MTHRSTFTLDDEAFAFLAAMGGENRSAYINQLLKKEKRQHLQESIARANREEAQETYQNELKAWDTTLGDGLDNDA